MVFGSDDGVLRVCDTQDASIRVCFYFPFFASPFLLSFFSLHPFDIFLQRNLGGHKGDVTVSRFFPSGQVVLSGALDWRLKVSDTRNKNERTKERDMIMN